LPKCSRKQDNDKEPSPVSHKVVKTLAFCGAKKENQYMTKTLSSITLLLLASGWLSILPAQTQTKWAKTKYVCTYCNKEFTSNSEESQKCPQSSIKSGQHNFRFAPQR